MELTRSLVAVKPRRPPSPKTKVDTETAFRHDPCKTRVHIQKVNMSEFRWYHQTQRSEFTLALNLDILDAGRSPNAVTPELHRWISSWPPATCKFSTRRYFDHHGKGSGNFVQKKCFEKWKKVVSLIDLKVMKTRNDCEIACDCVKRANVVLLVGLCKEIFARKHTATHKPTSAQPLYSYQRDI